MSKIEKGQFYTERDIFKNNKVFLNFMERYNLWNEKILEPFAGKNNLIKFIKQINPSINYSSYDIEPKSMDVKYNDSINNWFYPNYNIVITNPPYLSKHSARRMKIDIDFNEYDDLYKISIDRCIKNVRFTIAIIPTTLINTNRKKDQWFLKKLVIFQLLPDRENFSDTEHPVALAFFDSNKKDEKINFDIYENNNYVANYQDLILKERELLTPKNKYKVIFNKPNGNICINTGDNTKNKENIRFINKNWISDLKIKNTDRHKVKLVIEGVDITDQSIDILNNKIKELRDNKCDYLWSSFKGVSQNGHFRKRLDFNTIKKIINSTL